MQIITYKCDRCNADVENEKDLKKISFGVYDYHTGFSPKFGQFTKDMCKDCRVKIGISEIVLEEGQAVERKIVTTAEQLYDIISQMVYENLSSNDV